MICCCFSYLTDFERFFVKTKILNRLFDENKNSFPSQLVQSFVEVVAIIDVVRLNTEIKAIAPKPKSPYASEKQQFSPKQIEKSSKLSKSKKIEKKAKKGLLSVGRAEIRIERAELITRRTSNAAKLEDVSTVVAEIAESFDFAMLILPPKARWKVFFGVEVDAESELELAYRVVRILLEGDELVEREVARTEVSVKGEDDMSIFLLGAFFGN